MARLIALALMVAMNGNAGMGISWERWQQLRVRASFLGVFRDYRGARAAFFVEDKSGLLLGPLDLDAPSGPGWALPPAPAPALKPGDCAQLVYAAIVRAERPFGHPPAGDLSKSRIDKRAADPSEGMFVSAEKCTGAATETHDPLAMALMGKMPSLDGEEARRQAAIGFLLKHDEAQFRAAKPPADLARLGAVIFGGLGALEMPVAKLWLDGKKAEARALYRQKKPYLGHDRWRRPDEPMESSPGAPLKGPFLRVEEWGDADLLALSYLAPDFVKDLEKN